MVVKERKKKKVVVEGERVIEVEKRGSIYKYIDGLTYKSIPKKDKDAIVVVSRKSVEEVEYSGEDYDRSFLGVSEEGWFELKKGFRRFKCECKEYEYCMGCERELEVKKLNEFLEKDLEFRVKDYLREGKVREKKAHLREFKKSVEVCKDDNINIMYQALLRDLGIKK